jgi:ABC-type transporter Mla subunit MlaD
MASQKSSRPVRTELQEVVGNLRQIQSVLAVAVGALRQQNADIDADIANLLQRSVSDALQQQVEKLESVLRRLPPAMARKH